jgi:galactose oxidase-like protein/Kelch motif protein
MTRRKSHQFVKILVLDALLAIGLASTAIPAFAQSGTWKKTGNMKNALTAPPATLLQNGLVLVAGGDDSNGLVASAELYNPANGQWTATGSMNTAGVLTPLQNAQVLLTGADTELYNPSTGVWAATGNMSTARYAYTQTLLPNGKVLVAGGQEKSCVNAPCPDLSSTELYDPSNRTWTPTGSMNTARSGHTATLLANGLVLVAGGYNGTSALGSTELYNPGTGQWTATGSMNTARARQYAVLLANGQPLVLFGSNSGTALVTSTELYDPATDKWTVNGSTGATAQFGFSVTLLNTGKVLIAGGDTCHYPRPGCPSVTTAELYDPSVGASTFTGSMNVARSGHLALLLPNGQVLVAGGETQNNVGKFSMTNTAELYTP